MQIQATAETLLNETKLEKPWKAISKTRHEKSEMPQTIGFKNQEEEAIRELMSVK